jgi:phenylacetate-coenzyme A ligase PaaK-like adenylate-forming protein
MTRQMESASVASDIYQQMRARLPVLALEPDAWVRRMMRWHFSEETGSVYWRKRRSSLPFNPERDIRGLADLALFGSYDVDDLRQIDPEDLVPRGFSGRPRQVFETGGTTGDPCRIVDVTTGDFNVVMYRCLLEAYGVEGGNAIAMTPSGPHAYGAFVRKLIGSWAGNVMYIDFDPRWVKHLIRSGRSPKEYVQHLVDQTTRLLAIERATLLFTTSRLLVELSLACDKPLSRYGIRAVCTGGTSCSKEESRFLQEKFLEGVQWLDTYGNTLMGHALQAPPSANWPGRAYYLPPPLGYVRVVDPTDSRREVAAGERGRVEITTLLEDLFIPHLLERDGAIRVGPHPWFPWDGVAEPAPLERSDSEGMVEGVY